ncbi:PAS domain S-box protein [Synoicihabitans lomoniglobus]|uniref:histidine kinase n=1 Tax=Synoicihabitans lomoniglobus TaxID=2909285 RepID=A0AAE9ZXH5_9BACT|nr:PAS domain S-box protein [Opitutaceae bacterium LMO-M01]WED64358.1 PAS domain S-box protein [Opitutaceae bacterium LMO-M01]
MVRPEKHPDESRRIAALHDYGVLDTLAESVFDDLTTLAGHICDAPIALITLVDEDRQWFKSSLGMTMSEISRDISFCGHAILGQGIFEVPDALEDERFADNPLVTQNPAIRFYAGSPLVSEDGLPLGTLCVFDHHPRLLTALQRQGLEVLGRQVMGQLDLRKRSRALAEREARLNTTLDAARLGGFVWDVTTGNITGSNWHNEIWGLASGNQQHRYETLLDRIYPPDREAMIAAAKQSVSSREQFVHEFRVQWDDGSIHWVESTGKFEFSPHDGKPLRMHGVVVETTARRQSEETLRRTQADLERAQSISATGSWEYEISSGAVTWSDEHYRLWGLKPGSGITFKDLASAVHPADFAIFEAHARSLFDATVGFVPEPLEYRIQQPNGRTIYVLVEVEIKYGADGRAERLFGTSQDITARRLAEAALRQSETQLRHFVEYSPVAIAMFDDDMRYLQVSQRWRDDFRLGNRTLVGESHYTVFPEIVEVWRDVHRRGLAGEVIKCEEEPFQRADGRLDWIRWEVRPWHTAEGVVGGIIIFTENITERKRSEQLIIENQNRLRNLIDGIGPSIYVAMMNLDGTLLEVGRSVVEATGKQPEDLVGRRMDEIDPWPHPPAVKRRLRERIAAAAAGQPSRYDAKVHTANGRTVDVDFSLHPLRNGDGEVISIVASAIDITERRAAEMKVKEQEAILRETGRIAHVGGWEFDPATGKGSWTEEVAQIHDLDPVDDPDMELGLSFYTEKSRAHIDTAIQAAIEHGTPYDLELEMVTAKGARKWVRTIGRPEIRNGQVVKVRGSFQDITERVNLEEQFRQSQKMEAIGQLAGGVAHDFNNILAAILMQIDLATSSTGSPEDHIESMAEIKVAALRAAELTRQLLAFGRRQVMQTVPLNLNESVKNTAQMLDRIVGEDIVLKLELHPQPLMIRADSGMLDQVLLNLVVNARDAMPDGGALTIATGLKSRATTEGAPALPGDSARDYVTVKVTDSGSGMSPEVKNHIFEPFFTTKEPGKGTGLGLATAFGILKQHGGSIEVTSTVDHGSTFTIYLPVDESIGPEKARPVAPPKPLRGSETILLVEDDHSLRALTRIVLMKQGYTVLEAAHGPEALRVARTAKDKIHLLLTDMVMPEGMTGWDLAQTLQAEDRNLRVIFSSGYSPEVAGQEVSLQDGQYFISKPCEADQLLHLVRTALDA